MIFLGTAAAECCPDPFCACDFCENARTTGDTREKRKRSALLLDEENLIDFGPDVMPACGSYGVSLIRLKRIFITHSHEDHLDYFNLAFLSMSRTSPPKPALFMSRQAAQGVEELLQTLRTGRHRALAEQVLHDDAYFRIQVIEPYINMELDNGMRVMAVQGNHKGFMNDELSLNYLFEKDGDKLFYACDTGRFLPAAYEALEGVRLNKLVVEGSFGLDRLPDDAGHMDLYSLCDTLDTLIRQNTISGETDIYVTHIAHHAQMSHDEYERRLQERYGARIRLAWDGLRV